jgi:hypothetical protein
MQLSQGGELPPSVSAEHGFPDLLVGNHQSRNHAFSFGVT